MTQPLKSPRTGTPLTPRRFGETEIDVDDATGGVWLDGKELDALTEWFHDGDAFGELAQRHVGQISHDTVLGDCPRCQTKSLKEYPLPRHDGGNVTLDICESCLGLWVDGPELGPVRDTMLKNKGVGFQARIAVEPKRNLLMRVLYPGVVKNLVDRIRN